MSQRHDSVYLGHRLDMARKIEARIANRSRAQFDDDEDLQIVVTHLVQVIGEAASRVSQRTRVAHPEIPWPEIVGLRHRLVHDYLHVDYDIVWDVARNKLPKLIQLLEPLLGGEEG